MKETFYSYLVQFYEHSVFIYCIALFTLYALLTGMSRIVINRNKFLNRFRDYNTLLTSPVAAGISVIAPAYNESANIISNVRSLLTFNYPKFEVIVVNDGSTDDTLSLLIEEFALVQTNYTYIPTLSTKPVRTIYRSSKKAYSQLIVVDKENGGCKADAVNAGINAAHHPYFLNTDVDCILDNDTLIKLIQPILEERKTVIAVGASLRISNSCDIDDGMINRIRPPKQLLASFQEIEYTRSFSMGKLGWSGMNAVPNVSGALGLFNKRIAIKAGGYNSGSFAEDMDIIVRMSKYMCDTNQDYAIRYIPQTLCWTEGPTRLKVLVRQRVRWARGLWQLFASHAKIIFNPKYKRLGMVVFPYNLFFELLAPIIETIGIIYYVYIVVTHQINWHFAIILLLFVYCFSVFITVTSILWDQLIFRHYRSWKEVVALAAKSLLEPFLYHPLLLFSAIKGYLFQLFGKKQNWGDMERKGAAKKQIEAEAIPVPGPNYANMEIPVYKKKQIHE